MTRCKDCIHYNICCLWSTTDLDEDEAYKHCFGNFKNTEDVVPRAEVEEIVKFKDMAFAELKSLYIETTQEVAKGTVEIIQAHLNMLFVALQNEKTDATVEKLIEINSKIAILESIQLALGDVKKKYIGE